MLLNNRFLYIQNFLFKELCEIMKYNNICQKFSYKVSAGHFLDFYITIFFFF